MKKNSAGLTVMALALALAAMTVSAQDNEQRPGGPRPPEDKDGGPRPPRGSRPEGHQDGQRPPVPPLIAALDANSDGVIDEKEIGGAAKALKKLDKNSDGKLTMEELRPAHQPHDGKGGPDGQRRRGPGPDRGGNGPDDGGDRPARRGPSPQDDK